jgi:hypothetical protein
MSDADDLAQRYLAQWTQYLTALLADPRTLEMVQRWHSFASQFSYLGSKDAPSDSAAPPAWPPFLVPFGMPTAPTGGAVPHADGSAENAALRRRIDELEERIALLERQRTPPRRARRPVRAAATVKSP